jgi:HAD superfamily hydrolase (TIGR01490 family)
MSRPTTSASRQPIAAFDFDGTLLRGDCLIILHCLVRSPFGRLVDAMRLLPALLLWKSGLRGTTWFKQVFLRLLLTPAMQARTQDERHKLLHQTLADALSQRLRPEALARLSWHRQQGHRLVIVSASPRCLLQPIADRLEVDLIATESSDPTSGEPIRLTSPNCKGPEKIRRLAQWLHEDLQTVELHAYGDSRGDRELLQASTHPHWRSFSDAHCPYPSELGVSQWIAPLAIALLLIALAGLLQLHPEAQRSLLAGLNRLPQSLPLILVALGLAYVCRYWRWRLLLASQGLGHGSSREAWAWFQGFALTATPGKMGELSRVQQLHQKLGYARTPLFHVFLAERLCDATAVLLWLAVLAPGQLLRILSQPPSSLRYVGFGAAIVFGVAIVWIWRRRARWSRHLPSLQLSYCCIPATGISLAIWGLEAMILWGLVQAISPGHPIGLGQAISIYLLSGSVGMASMIPGGIGVNEAATTLLLLQAGLPASLSFSISILRRLWSVWLITVLAALANIFQPRY